MKAENTVVAGTEVVSGNEVEGAIRLPGAKPVKVPKLKKDGTPRKARKVTDDDTFLAAYQNAAENGGSIQSVADALGLEYGSVIQRRESINETLTAAGLPLLPDLSRASGPRKDTNKLLELVKARFPIGKGTLESLPVNAPIVQGPPAVTEDEEVEAESTEASA